MTDSDRHVRPFAEFLQEHQKGTVHNELSDALNELTEAVLDVGKSGSLTFTVKMKPAGRGDSRAVMVTDAIVLKKPQGERADSVFFADKNNNLVRENPAQPSFESLREVPVAADPADLKEAK